MQALKGYSALSIPPAFSCPVTPKCHRNAARRPFNSQLRTNFCGSSLFHMAEWAANSGLTGTAPQKRPSGEQLLSRAPQT